jgi:hypothetical protein
MRRIGLSFRSAGPVQPRRAGAQVGARAAVAAEGGPAGAELAQVVAGLVQQATAEGGVVLVEGDDLLEGGARQAEQLGRQRGVEGPLDRLALLGQAGEGLDLAVGQGRALGSSELEQAAAGLGRRRGGGRAGH